MKHQRCGVFLPLTRSSAARSSHSRAAHLKRMRHGLTLAFTPQTFPAGGGRISSAGSLTPARRVIRALLRRLRPVSHGWRFPLLRHPNLPQRWFVRAGAFSRGDEMSNPVLSACIQLATAQSLYDRDPSHYNAQRLERAKQSYQAVGGRL